MWSTRARKHSGGDTRLRRRANSMSSIRAISGNPPAAANASRANEHRLIAGRNGGEARAGIHEPGDDGEQRMPALDRHIEAPPGAPRLRQAFKDQPVGVGGQSRIGVQKQQHVAARRRCAGIHLRGAPARAGDHAVGERPSECGRRVAAAPIDNDDFRSTGPQRCQCFQRRDNIRSFVENRDDNGERRPCRHSAASFKRAAAARALAGGAAEAVARDADRIAENVVVEQLRQMHAFAAIPASAADRASG